MLRHDETMEEHVETMTKGRAINKAMSTKRRNRRFKKKKKAKDSTNYMHRREDREYKKYSKKSLTDF